ncbi:MAG: nucleotidyltransferase family protein [Paludibacteraceae bacterium]
MKCMIFAAGLGTRLKPLTDTMPKALVPVCGRPLLDLLLHKVAAAGFDEAVVNVHHFASQIIDFVHTHDYGMPVGISDESQLLLETGGGIKKAASLLGTKTPFLVHNVDILSNLNLAAFYHLHQPTDLATLLVSERPTTRYLLFDNDNRLCGWTNVQTGEIKSPYPNLDPATCVKRAFAGIHVLSPQVFALMQPWQGRFSIIDFYLSVCSSYTIRAVEMPGLQLLDVGKVDSLHAAEQFLYNQTQYD